MTSDKMSCRQGTLGLRGLGKIFGFYFENIEKSEEKENKKENKII